MLTIFLGIGSLVAVVLLTRYLLGRKSAAQVMESHQDADDEERGVLVKKYSEVNTERFRGTLGRLGLVAALGITLFAFETIKETEKKAPAAVQSDVYEAPAEFVDEEDIPDEPPPPPPPKGPTKKATAPPPPPPPPPPKKQVKKILDFAEVMPEYPGGVNALRKEVQRRYRIPSSMKRSGNKGGTITTRFVVLEDGSIGQVKILKGISDCSQCSEAAVSAVKGLKKKFTPGRQAGKPVKVWYTLPIVLRIE